MIPAKGGGGQPSAGTDDRVVAMGADRTGDGCCPDIQAAQGDRAGSWPPVSMRDRPVVRGGDAAADDRPMDRGSPQGGFEAVVPSPRQCPTPYPRTPRYRLGNCRPGKTTLRDTLWCRGRRPVLPGGRRPVAAEPTSLDRTDLNAQDTGRQARLKTRRQKA